MKGRKVGCGESVERGRKGRGEGKKLQKKVSAKDK